MRKIKLIWDFRGPYSKQTAEHHEKHLKEYILVEKLHLNITGFEVLNEFHTIAYIVVKENQLAFLRDALKPHRGQLFEE